VGSVGFNTLEMATMKFIDDLFDDDKPLIIGKQKFKWEWGIVEIIDVALIIIFIIGMVYIWLAK